MLTLARLDESALIVIAMLCALVALWIVGAYAKSILTVRQREATRREVAAYVAEGSMSAADAATILSAGEDQVRATIADAVAWGTVSPADAATILHGSSAAPKPQA
jgi:hypothetical protein